MRLELPRRIFDLLTAPQMTVANAMANRQRAREWMVEARRDPMLKIMHVSFARSAHRAYMNDLKRLEQFSRHPEIGTAQSLMLARRQAG